MPDREQAKHENATNWEAAEQGALLVHERTPWRIRNMVPDKTKT